ncbi:ketopantoate reductase family protein [Embleya sp. NBC_00896]|uniref:ketopantoate reductase family protein n=1 Tax=Embleya sp. NBC_00896 TaxID=2975961 RepID=UPI003865B5BD|nr:ketopantoate reductase family protein [Embleya sp. NBC_00896]
MRFVVLGAGAVGSVLGARLSQAGHDVHLVGRPDHVEAIREHGLRVESPDGADVVRIPAVSEVAELEPLLDWADVDAVVLCVKSHDTAEALRGLARHADSAVPIVCAQNGVANEDMALRLFANVYGVLVACPTAYLEPGVVRAYSSPVAGVLDIGRYPHGRDAFSAQVSRVLSGAGYGSEVRADITAYKYGKLVTNLGNAVEALCGPSARGGNLDRLAMDEARTVLFSAGIHAAFAPTSALVQVRPVGGERRPGGSSWQSLYRQTGGIETDYLNGEIVRIGRLHGVPTPVNAELQRSANRLVAVGGAPGSVSELDLLRAVVDGR